MKSFPLTCVVILGMLTLFGPVNGSNNNQVIHTEVIKPDQNSLNSNINLDATTLKIAYIYSDPGRATTFASLINDFGFTSVRVPMSSIATYNWTGVGLIILGWDTGAIGNWGSNSQVNKLLSLHTPFLAINAGGISFYNQVKSVLYDQIGDLTATFSLTGTSTSIGNSLNIWDGSHPIFNSPTSLRSPLPFYFSAAPVVDLIDSSLGSSVDILASLTSNSRALLTYENDRFFYWGITQPISDWAPPGTNLFENTLNFLLSEANNTAPVVDHPDDITYEDGITGKSITWNASDGNPFNYSIYKNNNRIEVGSWNSTSLINVSLENLDAGAYNYTIELMDHYGLKKNDTVYVTVLPTSPPILLSPGDMIFYENETGRTISWNASDMNPDYYIIYKNGTGIPPNNWSSDTLISYDVSGLLPGVYNITIAVYDTFGQNSTDTVFVTVKSMIILDLIAPTVIYLGNSSFEEGFSDYWANWSCVDVNPGTYELFLNSSRIETGQWQSDSYISYLLHNLTLGVYNLTILVTDQSQNWVVETVFIAVIDSIAPRIEGITNISLNKGETDKKITWMVVDFHPAIYDIELNGKRIANGSIEFSPFVIVSLNGLMQGYYNYTLIAFDTSNNSAASSVIVSVLLAQSEKGSATNAPTVSLFGVDPVYVAGVGFVIIVSASLVALTRRK